MALKVLSSEGYPTAVSSSGMDALYAGVLRFSKAGAFHPLASLPDEDFSPNSLLLQNLFSADDIAETAGAKKRLDRLISAVGEVAENHTYPDKLAEMVREFSDCPVLAAYLEECAAICLNLAETAKENLREAASAALSELKQIEYNLVYRIKDSKKHSLNREIMRQNLQSSKISAERVKNLKLLRGN